MMNVQGLSHVPSQDSMWSARRPRPASLRSGRAASCGLGLKAARYHHQGRVTDGAPLLPLQEPMLQGTHSNTHRRRMGATCATKSAEAPGVSANGDAAAAAAHEPQAFRQATSSVHAGERHGRPSVRDTITTPIVQNSTYFFRNTAELIDYNEGRYDSYEYGRYGNPTVQVASDKIKALEGAEDCLISASGMNAVTSMLLSLVPAGGHIVTTSDCYWRTRQFMQTFLPKMRIGVTVIKPNDLVALSAALNAQPVTLFFSESPTNPYLRCVDVRAISDLCRAKGAIVCIDSTFATPINSRAIALGADLVLHSGTKYLAGHNDVLCGALAGRKDLVDTVRTFHHIMGGVVDANAGYLLIRGMKTLELRVQRQNASALTIAQRLEKHPKIDRVWYPGLPSHPDHEIAKRQMAGFGGVVSFEVKGDLWSCAKFIDNVKLPYIAPSLGGVESLIEMPAVQSYWGFGPEGRAKIGIKENLVRFSIGIEDVEDVWADLVQALDQV